MKIISRHENEELVIGGDIHITVLKIRDDNVRLGISCPRRVPSYWEETVFVQSREEPAELELSGARF